jgi:hypothetical protein
MRLKQAREQSNADNLWRGDDYDPNQPRIPAGQPGGGRWTGDGVPPAANEEEAEWASGHSLLQDLLRGAGNDKIQKDADEAPEERVQPAFWPAAGQVAVRIAPVARKAIEAAIAAYAAAVDRNDRERQAVFVFRAREFEAKGSREIADAKVRVLDRKDVEDACALNTVQGLTENAVKEALKEGPYAKASDFGTAVHTRLAAIIRALGPGSIFKAERSYLKGVQESENQSFYGVAGSIRIDVLQELNKNTVCVFDIKTGKSGLSPARMREIAANVIKANPHAKYFVIVEVRPENSTLP